MRIAVCTKNKYLLRLIELELSEHEVCEFDGKDADVILADADSPDVAEDRGIRVIRLSAKGAEGAFRLPLPRGELGRLIISPEPHIRLLPNDRSALLDGKRIRLTLQEYKLLEILINDGGEYVTRERITEEVFETGGDSLINVYIHYLRKKLESDGRKIIYSSRKHGYKIDEKYIRGEKC